jgi:MHS family shikimate/dehydroshikimate transporter-like MFS transporter
MLMMGTATTLVGVLPTYATIGVAAPVLLFVLRFLQGLAVGGQWGGAILLATEYAPAGKRGFYGSFAQAGVPVGLVIGNAVFLVLSALFGEAAFAAWAWRLPFLFSVILIAVALYIQLRLEDTPVFRYSFYLLAMCAITFTSVYLVTETYEDEMTRDQSRAETEEAATT